MVLLEPKCSVFVPWGSIWFQDLRFGSFDSFHILVLQVIKTAFLVSKIGFKVLILGVGEEEGIFV